MLEQNGLCVRSLKQASNLVLLSFPQRGDTVMLESLQSGWRGVCDAAWLCNAGLWTAARLAPAWLLAGGRKTDNQHIEENSKQDLTKNVKIMHPQ